MNSDCESKTTPTASTNQPKPNATQLNEKTRLVLETDGLASH